MRAEGIVTAIEDNTAIVRIVQSSPCSSCSKDCASCVRNVKHDVKANNDAGAEVGEEVWVESPSSIVYLLVFLLYLLPLSVLPTVYVCTVKYFGQGVAAIFSIAATLAAFALLYLTVGKSIVSKNKYSIIRKI